MNTNLFQLNGKCLDIELIDLLGGKNTFISVTIKRKGSRSS